MTTHALAAELRAFLYACIESAEQVDLLISLRQASEARTVRQLAALMGVEQRVVRIHLDTLVARGLLHAEPGAEVAYTFAPRSEPLRRCTDQLAAAVGENRGAVYAFVAGHGRSPRHFSNAFRLRRDED